ncbi:uncharacterized protein PS065_003670 isoform 1-T2 [Dugong dugon]
MLPLPPRPPRSPQCGITSAPGHQNGAWSAHAHDVNPAGPRSRSRCSPGFASAAVLHRAARRGALVRRSCGRLTPPRRSLSWEVAVSALASSYSAFRAPCTSVALRISVLCVVFSPWPLARGSNPTRPAHAAVST